MSRYNTPITVLRLAALRAKQIRKWRADYEEEVAAWYRSGDGRSPKWHTFVEGDEVERVNVGGKGWRFPHCPHGMSLWTDYDNICGGCEDPHTVHEEALAYAWARYREFLKRSHLLNPLRDANAPSEPLRTLIDWSLEPLQELWHTDTKENAA